MQSYSNWYRDQQGNAVNAGLVSVYNANTSTLATIYEPSADGNSLSGKSNPFTTDANGFFSFAAPNGDYSIQLSGNSVATVNIPNINLFDGGATAGGPMVNPMSLLGDMIYGGTVPAGTPSVLNGNTTTTKKYLVQTGTGVASAVPAWDTITAADVPGVVASYTAGSSVSAVVVNNADAGRGPNLFNFADPLFNGTRDPVMALGYNLKADGTLSTAGENGFSFNIEGNYNDGSGQNKMEAYLQYVSSSGATVVRPIFFQMNRTTDKIVTSRIKGDTFELLADDGAAEAGTQMYGFTKNTMTMYAPTALTNTTLSMRATASRAAILALGYNAVADVVQIFPETANQLGILVNGGLIAHFYRTPLGGTGAAFAVGVNDNSAVGVFDVGSSPNGLKGVVIRAKATSSANMLEIQDSASANLFSVSQTGTVNMVAKAATSTSGDVWQDSTQKALGTFQDGIKQMVEGVIFTSTATATVANSVAETSIIGTGVGTKTLPANFFVAGKTVRLHLRGVVSETGTPTLQIKVKYGSTVVLDSTALALVAGIPANANWECVADITCRTTGATGTVQCAGNFNYQTATASSAADHHWLPANLATIDTTASSALDVTATWGTASASNTISGVTCLIEVLN
jgi:hypothetical protein